MAATYDDAVAQLYQTAHDDFVAERKRLAGELKATGDKAGAARLLALRRPTLSAWAVNQLWWQARDSFEQLFAAASRLRAGEQAGASERRDAVAALKAKAASILVQAGHAVNEATLRRVSTTLSALAAAGGFEPDAPGALASDRDPPGFDAAGLAGFGAALAGLTSAAPSPAPEAPASPAAGSSPAREVEPRVAERVPTPRPSNDVATPRDTAREQPATPRSEAAAARERERHATERERRATEERRAEERRAEEERRGEERRVAAERAERERVEREQAERELAERLRQELEQRRIAEQRAERQRLEASLPSLRSDLERRQREVERLRAELARVEELAARARSAIADVEERLAKFVPL